MRPLSASLDDIVFCQIAQKLSPMPPDNVIIFGYLNNIASQYNIDWKVIWGSDRNHSH